MYCTAVVGYTTVSKPYERRPEWCPLYEVTDTDTISRQAVLDAIQNHFNPTGAELSPDLASVLVGVAVVINTMPPSPSRPQWIPCSERLPDGHRSVLCCTYGGTHFIGHIKEAKQGEYMAVSGDSDYKTVYEIVAWMPLPEPYQGN
jgi:hypothetical protein